MQALLEDLRQLRQSRALLWTLVRREIAARHAGTAAGAIWSYAQPILTVAVYYLVFDVVFAMRLGEKAPVRGVGAFLIVGSLPWMSFCDTINRSMGSLVDAGGLLQKNALPAVLFPMRTVVASSVIFGPLMLALIPLYAHQHHFSGALLAMPLLLLLQLLMCSLLGYLLAVFAAALRDTIQIIGFLLSLGIFVSPVLFPLSQFPERWQWVLWFNPMTALVMGYQDILLQGVWPHLGVWVATGSWIVGLTVLLSLVLSRSRDQLVDWL